jgi:hypothetical protein
VLQEEGRLARLVEPLLEMVGDRRPLIFSPGIDMANNVANYINARAECLCPQCGKKRWVPTRLLGDGATCKCGFAFAAEHVTKGGEQARSINGTTPVRDRQAA